ncbi:nicotinamide-nucleotide amidase [Alkalihalobacillus xiaoxiensis]|uniref:Putative competence-damage inducible protein n=1 Tax=Shouchella xiaoxiensis TaxID=766895 RepID=A0ABS2ST92_9BACI|nr:competence/damage-inducible protein A [Shouchella xiaoxiensis]MBM7837714.1 nicotinamide-nucleotide amidase [Shouchella xiaoxiensis]
MNAEVIAVGSELLLGQIANTNGQFISKQLASIGVNVYSHTVVGDNQERLTRAIEQSHDRSDVVILTGGLGPTKDDLTKETVASFCGRKLVYDQQALEYIETFFKRHNRTMTPNNKKQAYVIEDATVLANRHGMAPGMVVELADQKKIVLLPGPPSEMKPMFEHELMPLLLGVSDQSAITSRIMHFFGIGESQLETDLEDLIDQQTNPTIAPLAGDGEVKIRLTVKHTDQEEAIRLLDETERLISARVGSFLYGYNETTLVKESYAVLSEQGLSISSAESLTAGLFSSELASVPGASQVLKGSITAYTNEIKQVVLGVSNETLATNGAVSEECALEMARGAKRLFQTDVAIAFTGVAGPDKVGDQEAGVVKLALVLPDGEERVYALSLSGGRNAVRKRAVKYGYFYLLEELKRRNGSK